MPDEPKIMELDEAIEILRKWVAGRPSNKGPAVYQATHRVLVFMDLLTRMS